MIRIVFFAPYPQIFSEIRRAFDDRPDRDEFEYEIRQDYANNPLKGLDADMIIARGFTAKALEKAGIPCTEIQVSGYDVMEAISRCQSLVPGCRKIAVIGPFNMIYGSEAVNDIIEQVSVTSYIIDDETHMDEAMQQAIDDGNEAIVGTHSVLHVAEKFRMPVAMIESRSEAITSAITRAKELVLLRRKEQEHSARIANIMNFSFQGIVAADKSGRIIMANSYVYSILKVENSLLGQPLTELFPTIPVDAVVKNGAKILSELYRYRSMTLLVNCVPVSGGDDPAGCVLTFQNITHIQRQEDAIRKKLYRKEFRAKAHFSDFLHQSGLMSRLLKDAQEYSLVDSPVIISGEAGTGKEMLAESMHNYGKRKNRFYVSINCAAYSETALERELFGFADGAVRGMPGEKAGAFELAHQGTLFLDEIWALSLRLQARLLRILQEHEVTRLGSSDHLPVNVRLIASSDRDLKEEIRQGRFRSDLYYRINVLELRFPPLRERPEDIPFLISHSLSFEKERLGGTVEMLGEKAQDLVMRYEWPGNVRELENFCERLSILCPNKTARQEDVIRVLPELGMLQTQEGAQTDREEALQQGADEKTQLLRLLDQFDGNRKKTAEYLGINPSTLWRKMKKMGIL